MHIFLSDEDNYARSVIYPLTHTVLNVSGYAHIFLSEEDNYARSIIYPLTHTVLNVSGYAPYIPQ